MVGLEAEIQALNEEGSTSGRMGIGVSGDE